jgi:DNA primase
MHGTPAAFSRLATVASPLPIRSCPLSQAANYEIKQRVKQAVDIVDLVGSYLPLRREGRAFKALCPWHDDTRPSLQVNPERQSFKCWVCDVGGDIFSFLMKIEGVEFPEALAMLADRANIRLQPPARGEAPGPVEEKRVLYKAMAWALEQYHQCLLDSAGAGAAREYLTQRGIRPESIRRFQLGFAPDEWSWLTQQARGTSFTPALLERIGLVSPRRAGPGYYDRFKGRVLFPIFDSQGRAVGLGGRVLPQLATPETAKYVNSPETPLFSKSRLLYGLNIAREAIRKTKSVLVMEGYTDCITAHQFGFENTVAVLGTAVGAGHIELLRRFADGIRVVLVLDGDEAGRKRANEVLELFVSGNVDLRVLTLPEEMDPADYLFQNGAAAFENLVSSAVDGLTHAFEVETAGIDLQNDLHAAARALEQLLDTIAKAPRLRNESLVEHQLREYRFFRMLATSFHVPEEQVRQRMTEIRRKKTLRAPAAAPQAVASVREKLDPLERELIEILLQFPQMIEPVALVIQPAQFGAGLGRSVFSLCGRLWSSGILPDFERLLLEIDDPVVKNLLVELDEAGCRKAGAEADVWLRDVLAGFERRQQEQWVQGRTAALKQRQLAEEDELAVLVELEKHQRARQEQQELRGRQGISDPTDG